MFSSQNSQVSSAANYIEDVFSTYLYTGNGSTQTITNGIDLTTYGGLVWSKCRSSDLGGNGIHTLIDTVRGAGYRISSELTGAQAYNDNTVTGFSSTGFSIGNSPINNTSSATFVSWTFRKQAKFFDVVTYTGNATAGRTIAHSLGSTPGCIIVKQTGGGGSGGVNNWFVYHRSLGATQAIILESTGAAFTSSSPWNNTAPTSTVFSVGGTSDCNDNGGTYVAYVFAHNAGGFGLTGTDNVISCGSVTLNSSGAGTVNLGYEPQWVLMKTSSSANDWIIFDTMRGFSVAGGSGYNTLNPNLSAAEFSGSSTYFQLTNTGFSINMNFAGWQNENLIYIAIRRGPMKVPTDGTTVFSPTAATQALNSNTSPSAGFPVDTQWLKTRNATDSWLDLDRLRGSAWLSQNSTSAETALSGYIAFDSMTSVRYTNNLSSASVPYIFYNFKRAPSFFDEVCYTGTGTNTVSHNLNAVPELIIVKKRSSTVSNTPWVVYSAALGNGKTITLNGNAAAYDDALWDYTTPTASVFSVRTTLLEVNYVGATYVAYLFATCAGVSKVGSVTHSEPTTVSCGFTPRFVLIKSTQDTGTNDWFVFDSARGITSGNDPYLRLNSTGAENTPFGAADLVDPTADGFIMNGFGGGNYIYLAIA